MDKRLEGRIFKLCTFTVGPNVEFKYDVSTGHSIQVYIGDPRNRCPDIESWSAGARHFAQFILK